MQFKLVILMVAAIVLGCARAGEVDRAASSSQDKVARPGADNGIEQSPQSHPESAAVDISSITVESPPEAICRAFIDCLRQGDHAKAEKFLSQESITQTRKQSLDLAMPAGEGALYTIGAPVFATNQRKIAFVTIDVTDRANSASPPQSFSMMLKNGNFGWKIAGMMMGAESASQELYSFENPLDVLRIKSMLEGDSRQARVPDAAGENRLQ